MSVIANDEKGATMIEVAMSVIIILILLGLIFDVGMGLHEYNYLNHITSSSARDISREFTVAASPEIIENYFQRVAMQKMSEIGQNGLRTVFNYRVQNFCTANQSPFLEVRSALPLRCIFACTLIPNNWQVTASSRVLIETSWERRQELCRSCAGGNCFP